VKNLSIAARRERTRIKGGSALPPDVPDASAPARDDRGELGMVMTALPESHREVLLMRFVDGLSSAAIGHALATPKGP
jgi:DNA-directed RNA polymerase specialized sigma24 family protein